MMKLYIKIRIFLWSVLALVILWLAYQAIVPFGRIVYTNDFREDNYFIRRLAPVDRVKNGEGQVKIIGDPVYFSLRTPRRFSQARLTMRYKTQGEQPVIETGVLVDKTVWRYELEPIENRLISRIAEVWEITSESGLVLFQRKKDYNSVEEFLSNLPDPDRIAVYNYNLAIEYLMPDYSNTGQKKKYNIPLRGPHQFYTYIKDEPLDFTFTMADLNQNQDSDPVDINLYFAGELIDSRRLEDDGITTDSGENKPDRMVELKLANLPEGVYKIELRANDDIVIKELATVQSKLAFINQLRLYPSGQENLFFYTDSQEIQATTIHPGSRQMIFVNEKNLNINETYRQFSLQTGKGTSTDGLHRLELQRDGVIISGNGTFSFSRESHINPGLKKLDQNLDINDSGIDYILADYQGIRPDGEWHVASANLDLTRAYRENNEYSIIISIPGLRADDEIDDYIVVDEIKVELTGKRLVEKIRELVN